jgi:acetylornithine/LysW-gamma-L-lysine aminotransferase
MTDFIELEKKFEFDVYPKRGITLVKGKNAKVWDDKGKEYIDCVAGHGSVNIGHCNEKVAEAVCMQSKKLITCSGIFYNDVRAKLVEKLVSIAPDNLTRAFLCNSGSEAVEAAIKFCRFTNHKPEFICAMRGFHGRTLGALSATFNPKFRDDFKPLVPGFIHVPFNNFEKLKEKVSENTSAVILEVVQGEGGIHVGSKEYFKQVRDLCDEKGILLVIDEVQTGFCRTGRMFGCENFDLKPDIMCLAKSIAGGVPMGAVLCSDKVKIPLLKHGTTFGGNPLACSAALASIDFMLENKLAEETEKKGAYVMKKLNSQKFPKVREIRQIGLMIGIDLREKSRPYIEKLMELGVLALPAGPTVLRLLPPLTISYEELDFVLDKVIEVLK